MAKLTFSALASLDGYVADREGKFGWAMPDEEIHAAVNDLERQVGTHLYGRRMYEVLQAWETMDTGPGEPQVIRDYAEIWRAAEKVVYSRTLEEVSSSKTRIEREFVPEAIRELKSSASADLAIGGPTLAAEAFAAGLVDECNLFLFPVLVGEGKAALPSGLRVELELLGERRFGSGVVHLHYRVTAGG